MIRVGLCGGVTLEVDGRRQPDRLLAGRQGRLVLAYLVCERHRSVSRDELAELVWGERLPSSWASSLSAVISKLRRLLSEAGLDGPAVLASSFGSYRLHLPADAWVDWDAAHAGLAEAQRAMTVGDAASALTAAADAEEIARRGFHTDDCEWVDAQRERLRELRVSAAAVQVQAHLLAGERHKAVAAANNALDLDDRRESSYRLLMEALAAAGERGEALRVWERCRIMLVEELGTDPAPETEAVYLSLLGDTGPAPQQPQLPTGVVTFLLTDIVDSTTMWERHPAAMSVALERHDRLVGQAVAAHGGTLLKAKLEGDATISVFPRATAGVLAALELSELLAAEDWPENAAPAVRTALHTGEAIERDGDYFGPALNRAARLRAMTGGGQLVVSQAVAEVVRDHLPEGTALHSLGEHQLKGLSRAEHVFELVPTTSDADAAEAPIDATTLSRPALPAILARGSPFVGRQPELAKLETEWATALAGTPRAVLVAGEPGVGKTRLAAEWARSVYDQGGLVLYGRCDEELGAPYQPFAEALRSVVPHLGAARLRAIRGVEDLARLAPELRDLMPDLAAPTQADPDTERYLLFDALARLLETVSRAIPILVVVDDLHWAAKPTLLMLRHLLRSADGTRLLIVGTYRSTDLDRSHPLAAALADLHSDGATERVALSGLDAGEVSAYLSAAGYDDSQLGKRLATVTSGNPFFLIEVLRHVDESGGHWTSTNLPQGVKEAVSRRLSRLSETANEALLVGAVAGSRFALGLVEQVTGRDLVEPIDEARRAGLVVEEPNARFRFDHALVRQSLLTELASVKRVRLHQRIAAALEADTTLAGDAPLADLARHWFECAYAGGAAKAVDYSRRAAEEATVRLAYEEAAQFYDQAVQAADVEGSGCDDETVAELLLAHAEALLAAGDPTAVGPVLAHLERVAHGSTRLSAWQTCYAAQLAILIHPEQLDAAASDSAGAAEQFASLSDAEGEAKAHTVRAGCLSRLGRIADCEAALDRALTAGRQAGNPRRVNAVLAGAPVAALWGPSPVARASGRCLDVVRVLRITTGSPAVEAVALRCQAVLEALRDRTDASRRMLASARRSLEGLGHVHGLLETDVFDGLVELYAGDPAGAEASLRRAYDGFTSRGVGVDAAQAAALLARAVLGQGRVDEAIALTHDAERLAGDDLKAAIAWRAARAEALAEQGSIGEALDAARAAVALADATDALIDQADAHLALAVVQRAAGDLPASEAESHRATELYERKGAVARVETVRNLFARPAAESPVASRPTIRRRVRPNLATDLSLSTELNDDTIAEWAARYADEVVLVDHRFQMTLRGRQAAIDTLRAMAHGGHARLASTPLASLGQRHALMRSDWSSDQPGRSSGPSELSWFNAWRVDGEGLLVCAEVFDESDLNLALARLIDMHAEDELPPERRAARTVISDHVREQRLGWSADAILADHRPASLGTLRGRESISSAAATMRELTPDLSWRVVDVLGLAEHIFVLEIVSEGHDQEGGRVQFPVICVLVADDDGLLSTADWYSPEQIDEAIARFDELSPEDPPDATVARLGQVQERDAARQSELTNLAVRSAANFAAAAYRDRDFDTLSELTHADMFVDDRRSMVGGIRHHGREEFLEMVRGRAEIGVSLAQIDPMALRGDRLALSKVLMAGDDFEIEMLGVAEVDSTGRYLASVWFDIDHPDAAFDELDRRYLAGEGADYADTVTPWLWCLKAIGNNNAAAFRALLSDGLEVVDHRPPPALYADVHSADELVAAVLTMHQVMQNGRVRMLHIDAINSAGFVYRQEMSGLNGEGGEVELPMRLLCLSDRGMITRLEMYAVEHREVAVARLHELTAPSVEPSSEVLTNLAHRLYLRYLATVYRHQDFDAGESLMHRDFVLDDRRSIVGGLRHEGPGAGIEVARSRVAIGVSETPLMVVAIRGERLVLTRLLMLGSDFEIEALVVTEFDPAGLYLASVAFDPDALDAAFDELDRRYLAGEGADFVDTLGLWFSWLKAYERNDPVGLRRVLSDGFEVVDHRPQPSGLYVDIHGPDEFTAAVLTAHQVMQNVRLRMLRIDALNNAGFACRLEGGGSNSEGGAVEVPLRLLGVTDRGLITRLEMFVDEEPDAAMARLHELTRPRAETSGEVLTNLAHQTFVKVARVAYHDHDWEAFASLTHPNMVLDDRRPLVGGLRYEGRENVIPVVQSRTAIGVSNAIVNPIAIRGERLVLARCLMQGPDFEIDVLLVVEVDPAGLYSAAVVFEPDELDAAFDELDARFLAGEGRQHTDTLRPGIALLDAYNRNDSAAFRSTLSDSFQIVDHRPPPALYNAVRGPDESAAAALLLHDLSGDVRARALTFDAVTSAGFVQQIYATGSTADGGDVEISYRAVVTVEGPLITRWEFFPVDQRDAALARLDELAPAPASVLVRPNACAQLVERFLSRSDAGDIEGAMACFGPDVVLDDRRPGIQNRLDRSQLVESLRMIVDFCGRRGIIRNLLASRGDRLALYHFVLRGSSGGGGGEAEVAVLRLFEQGDRGLLEQTFVFPEEDLDAAFDELDRLYAAGEAAPFVKQWNVATDLARTLRDWDPAALRGLLSRDFILSDRRRVSILGQLDKAGWIDSMSVLRSQVPDVQSRLLSVHRLGRLGGVATTEYTGHDGQGGELSAPLISLVVLDPDAGTVNRFEAFDPEDLDVALARFDELAGEPLSVPARPNGCAQLAERFLSRCDVGDLEGAMACVGPHILLDDRRPGIRDQLNRPKMVESLRMIVDFCGGQPMIRNLLASRGDRLALYHLVLRGSSGGGGGEAEVALLQLFEQGDGGLAKQMIVFPEDDLDSAFDELDRLYAAGEAAPFATQWKVATAVMRGVRDEDPAALRGLLSEGFVLSDRHRVSIFGQMDREAWIEFQMLLRSQVPDLRSRIVSMHRLHRRGGVAVMNYTGHDSQGGELSVPGISVAVIDPDAGTLDRMDVFDPEDLDAALALFEQLIAEQGDAINTATAEEPRPEVGTLDETFEEKLTLAEAEGWRTNQRFVRIYNERDWDALRALLDPDSVIVDERMTGWGRIDRDQFIVHLRQLVGLVGDAQLKVAAVHLVSPRGVAARFEVTGTVPGGGEFEMDFEAATTVEHGRIVGLDLLPEGDVAEVTRRLG